jgi:Tfp pilus assembly protein FimT
VDLTDIADLFGWGGYLAVVCGIAAILAAFAPPATEQSPAWWKRCRVVLDLLAANFRNARNRRA